jgi:site-specific recombinase XerD
MSLIDLPPAHPCWRNRTPAQRADEVPQPLIRPVIARYLTTISATLRPATVTSRAEHLTLLAVWLAENHPECRQLTDLTRGHLEDFLAFNATRHCQGKRARGERISVTHHMHVVINLRNFFDDITAWGWSDRPATTVVHRGDIPRPPAPLPRALSPQTDSALMKAVSGLKDTAAKTAITLLRGTGLRLGELLDLELDCLWDLPGHGTWLKVPLGKLNSERVVPLDDATLAVLDQWMSERGPQRSLPHPRTGRTAHFLFTIRGARIGANRIRKGLADAVRDAGLVRADGTADHVTPHQLRHTYATSLANAGMSLQALMALLGHVTPEMTTRYVHLADTTLRTSYDAAMAKARETRQLPLVVSDRPIVPERIEWLHSEMLKTRVAHGYCSRHLAAEACPYANICEQCDNYTTSSEFLPQIQAQIDDEAALRDDALARGWDSEVARHARVIASLQRHLDQLKL